MEIKTKTQIKAYDNIVNCVNYIVGGRENEYSDFPELRESVVTYLTNRPAMIEDVYHYVLNTIYVDGCCTNASPAYIKQIKFLGRKWLIECITEVLMNTMKDSAIEEVKEAWRAAEAAEAPAAEAAEAPATETAEAPAAEAAKKTKKKATASRKSLDMTATVTLIAPGFTTGGAHQRVSAVELFMRDVLRAGAGSVTVAEMINRFVSDFKTKHGIVPDEKWAARNIKLFAKKGLIAVK